MAITGPHKQDPTKTQPAPGTTAERVWVGVDTHQRVHHAAVVTADGGIAATAEFPADRAGYACLHAWAEELGTICSVGIEQTGTYGAGLSRYLLSRGVRVIEVNHTDPALRARQGKTDQLDAVAAARAVAAGSITTLPKTRTGAVEAIRVLSVARNSAVASRTRLFSQLRDVITTADDELRTQLQPLSPAQRVKTCAKLRATGKDIVIDATKRSLRSLARQIQALTSEADELDTQLKALVADTVPTLVQADQIGTHTAAQLAVTAGQNLHRIRSEAAFARLSGVAPIPASSGKTNRHRLHRGGDRQANKALHIITIGRLKNHHPTRAYMTRRLAQGKTKTEIIRCLKRHIAREVYHALKHDLTTT